MMEIKDHFSICILEDTIDLSLSEKVKTDILPLIENLPRDKNNTHFSDFHSNKLPINDLFPKLLEEFWRVGIRYARHTGIKISRNNSLVYWTQDYKEGDSHEMHHHGIDGISGIYIVRANNNAGKIRFYNPNQIADYVEFDNYNSRYSKGYIDYEPKEGSIIVFPSYLKHKVISNNSNVIRTTIPFNILRD